MRRNLGFFLILLGCVCILFSFFLLWQRNDPSRLAFAIDTKVADADVASTEITPTSLQIPTLALHLPIIPASLNNGKWQATAQGISYLVSSPIPGETGNSILYGHNWPTLLGQLPKLTQGAELIVHFSDGTTRVFTVQFTSVVNPDQTHTIAQTTDQRLTLYTCTGFLDSKRFVVTAIRS